MISRRILAAVALLCALIVPAHAQKTKAQLSTEITTTYPDNTTGAITPAGVRAYESDVINSIMPTAPVVAGNAACFSGTTGLLQDCGSVPAVSLFGDCTVTSLGAITCTKTGGVAFAASATINTTNAANISSGTLNSARLPSPFTNGTTSGNTAAFATVSGTLANGHCVQIDASGNLVDSGSACGGGGGGTAQIFDTRAAAIAASISSSVSAIYLNGYSAAGDGGRSEYKRISTPSPVKAWNFQSADGAWWQLAETTVNPKQLGAVCDGTTDDGAVLQSINDYLSAVWSGGTFYMTPGLNCAAATQNITLSQSVAVKGAGTITRTVLNVGPVFVANGLFNVSIEDVHFAWGAAAIGVNNNDEVMLIEGCTNPVVKNTVTIGAFYIAIEDFKNVGSLIDGNHIAGYVNRAIYPVSDATGISTHSTIVNNVIDGFAIGTTTRQANYGINGDSSNLSSASANLLIANNNIRNVKNNGLVIGGFWTNATIANNNVDNVQDGSGAGVGITVELADGGTPNNFNVTGNSVSNVDGTSIITVSATGVNIIGNTTRGGNRGIWISDTLNSKVASNFVNGAGDSGIVVTSTSVGSSNFIQIDNNRSNSNTHFGYTTDNNTTNTFLFGNSGVSNVSGLYSVGTGTGIFDQTLAVLLGSPNTFTAVNTFSATGAPVTVNSTNSNGNKITQQDNGTTRGFMGSTSGVPLLVSDPGAHVTFENTFSGTTANFPALGASASGGPITLSALGTDTNIGVNIVPKNGGTLQVAGINVSPVGSTPVLTGLPTAPATFTATTPGVMMGLGVTTCRFTPVYSSRVEFYIYGQISNVTAGDAQATQVRFGTGAGPANGVAPTGTTLGTGITNTSGTASSANAFWNGGIATGLTPGTTYWFDLAAFVSAGTGQIGSVTCVAKEVL